MDRNPRYLIQKIAQNYRVFLADFPPDLKPEHLDVPIGEQASTFEGLFTLHTIIGKIYEHFSRLVPDDMHWEDREYCVQAIERPVKLLWAMSAFGGLSQGPNGLELNLSQEVFDLALKKCGCKNPVKAFGVLKAVGIELGFWDPDGLPLRDNKKFVAITMRYPAKNDPFLRAMVYYVHRLPEKKSGRKEKGVIFEVILRADFRPLLPGYTFHVPHLPATIYEVTRTFSPETLEVWNELTKYMTDNYPQFQLYFRVPFPRSRRWAADYSNKDNDYGLWSIFVDEEGLAVRIVMIEGTINNMLDNVGELSPGFQESYLNAVACKDCIHCGKHVFYTHGDHIHKLCKSPWFASPYLHLEDLPDIERLIDYRLG